MKRHVLSFIILCFWGIYNVSAQSVNFNHFTVREGLSQSEVLCIFEDKEGFLWFGTQNGLNKFDGYQFTSFFNTAGDSTSISNNWIFSISEDPRGNLLIGTKGGLNLYEKASGTFSLIPYLKSGSEITDPFVYGVTSDSENIYVNVPPILAVINTDQGTVDNYKIDFPYSGILYDVGSPILKARDGTVWIGSHEGLYRFDTQQKTFRNFNLPQLNHKHITALYEDEKGRIWIGTEAGLNCYHPRSDSMSSFFTESSVDELSSNYIRTLIIDNSGKLWAGTDGGGLYRIDLDENGFPGNIKSFRSGKDTPYMLGHDIVYSLHMDPANNLWIGTLAGIDEIDLKKNHIVKYRKTDDPFSIDLLDNVIASVYQDDSDRIWIGTWGKGLNILNRKTGKVIHYTSSSPGRSIPEDHVHVIFEDRYKRIWLGTRNGVVIYNPQENSFIPVHEFFHQKSFDLFNDVRVYCMVEDLRGRVWIGTGNGIRVLDPLSGKVLRFQSEYSEPYSIGSNLVYSLYEDSYGLMWIATSGGLDCYNPKSNDMNHYRSDLSDPNSINEDFIIALNEDDSSDMWISNNQGINCFSRKDSVFTAYSIRDGLPSAIVYNILKDHSGKLWLATGNGIAYTDPGIRPVKFEVVEDLLGMEFNLRAAYYNQEGELFFGGMDGMVSFFPDSLKKNTHIPPVRITSFEKERDGERQKMNVYSEKILLSYKDYSFTIEFAALDYTKPAKNRYAYKMEGISNKWNDIGQRNFVHFTNLPAGEYKFFVKGSNDDGVWNEEGTSLSIKIFPPWWRSDYAYAAYLILLVLLIVMIIRLRERNLVREKKRLEEKVTERTAELARQKERVEESEEMLKSTINSIDDLVFVLDNEGIFREFYNPGKVDVNHRDPSTYINKHYTRVGLPEIIVKQLEEISVKLKDSDHVQEFDYYFGEGEQKEFYNAKISPRRNSKGELTGLVIVSRNITYRKKAEQQLEKQKEELRELNSTKDRFFSILAHDLKNPFTNLYSMSDLLIRNYDVLDEEEKMLGLKNLNKSAGFIFRLLENLLTWSRAQRGKITYNPEKFNLSNLVGININLYRPAAEKKGLKIISHVEDEMKVYADRQMTDTVIRNLLSNAVKFTGPGGKITFLAEKSDGRIIIRIADEGVGIPAEDMPKLFQIDEKYKTKGTEGETGTGLGLVLCKEFVERNGGRIWCDSKAGKGTVFSFSIPSV